MQDEYLTPSEAAVLLKCTIAILPKYRSGGRVLHLSVFQTIGALPMGGLARVGGGYTCCAERSETAHVTRKGTESRRASAGHSTRQTKLDINPGLFDDETVVRLIDGCVVPVLVEMFLRHKQAPSKSLDSVDNRTPL